MANHLTRGDRQFLAAVERDSVRQIDAIEALMQEIEAAEDAAGGDAVADLWRSMTSTTKPPCTITTDSAKSDTTYGANLASWAGWIH